MYRLGLDIQSSSIQAILLKKGLFGRIKIIALNSIEVNEDSLEDDKTLKKYSAGIEKALQSAIPHAISKKHITIAAIPESKMFSHIFALSKETEDKNIEIAILIEAEKIIPYPINELYYDFELIKGQDDNRKVLFACIPKTTADQFFNLFQLLDISVKSFTLQSNADRNALLDETRSDKNKILLDIRHQSTHIIIVKSSEIVETEFIHLGLQDFIKSEKKGDVIVQIADNVQKVLKRTRDKNSKLENTLIICGTALENDEFNQYLQKNIKMKFVIDNPWRNIGIDRKISAIIKQNPEISKKKAVSFSTAIGLAMQDFLPQIKKRRTINLLPAPIKETIKLKLLVWNARWISLFLTISVFALLYYLSKDTADLYFAIKKLEGASDRSARIINSEIFQQTNKIFTELEQETTAVKEVTKNQYMIHEVLNNLITYIPKEVKMTKIELKTSEYQVDLSGIVKKREDILTTVESLKKIPYLKKLDFPLSLLDKKENISFTLKITLDESKLPK